jgi:hypothetical protein
VTISATKAMIGTVALMTPRTRENADVLRAGSDGLRKLVARCRDPEMRVSGANTEFVVAPTQVLHERVAPNDHLRGGAGLQSAHRAQPCP